MKTFASVTGTPCTCQYLERAARNPDYPIEFDERLNEFHIVTKGAFGKGELMIYHCPLCGGEAPESIRPQLFATVSISEEYRLRELVRDCQSYGEAKQKLGPPDWEPFIGVGNKLPAPDGQPPISEAFPEAHYKSFSDTADLIIIDYPNRRIGVRVQAKYIGLPGEQPVGLNLRRNIPPDMDADVVAEIDARLDGLESSERVKIGFAIESGSRAWGFPSPDSDYDCRFVYIRPRHDYLSLFQKRDVIETPMTPVLDVNGWDIAKAIKLLLAGNAVIVEWLTSPIIYRANSAFCAAFLDLARAVGNRDRFAHHYIRLAQRTLADKLDDTDDVALKKVFYALRPALALRWLTMHPGERVPPMDIQTLISETQLPGDLTDAITGLIAQKKVTRELGRGPMPPLIRDAIHQEIDSASKLFEISAPATDADKDRADVFFRVAVERYAPA
ncbi:MAG: nucleotidyltransferase domain-containing protein [Hyphomicrobium sp.]